MKKLGYVFAALFIVASAPFMHAQKVIERTVAVFDFAPMNNSDAQYSSICADTIAIELERIGYTVLDTGTTRKTYKGSLIDEPALIQFAQEQQADVVVMGFYSIEGTSIYIGVRAIDILTGLTAVAIIENGKGGVQIFDTIDEITSKVAKKIREALQPIPESVLVIRREITKVETKVIEEVIEQGTPVTIFLLSKDEGAEVYSGDTYLGTIENGRLSLDTKEDSSLILTLQKANYYPRTITIKATSKKPENMLGRLQPIAKNEFVGLSSHDRPMGLYALYSRAIFADIFYYGGQTGFFFIPADYNFDKPEEHNPNAFFEFPLYATLTFYPIGIFAPQYIIQPYIRGGIGGELYFANFPVSFSFAAVAARGIITFGLIVFPGQFALSGEVQVVSPSIVDYGTLTGMRGAIHVCIGVRHIW